MNKIVLLVAVASLIGCGRNQELNPKVSTPDNGPAHPEKKICGALFSPQGTKRTSLNPDNEPKRREIDASFENYIVKFRQGRGPFESHSLPASGKTLREYGVEKIQLSVVHSDTYSFALTKSVVEKRRILEELSYQQDVEFIEPDYPIFPTSELSGKTLVQNEQNQVPNDPYFTKQWFHQIVNSQEAWSLNQGSDQIVVAVVDTGIDYTHPDLKDNMWKNPNEIANGIDDDKNGYIDDIFGWNFVSNNSDPKTNAKSAHGTHVAGTIGAAGNNAIGVIGIAPHVKLMALRFMGDTGTGTTSAAIRAIDYAVEKNVFLINNSWGSGEYSRALQEAITRAEKAQILFFAAAGNGRVGGGYNIEQSPWYPASYLNANVFGVAASDSQDQLTKFSNYSLTQIDVAAPGFSILSTVSGTGYQSMNGTSMATPLAAGIAVLVKATNPQLSSEEIMQILRNTVDPISEMKTKIISGGRVNALKAVRAAAAMKKEQTCKE